MSRAAPRLGAWLQQVRRRVRVRRGLLWMGAGLVVWAAASVALLLLARVEPLGWEEVVVVAALPVAAIGPFIAGLVQPLPLHLTARAADRARCAAGRSAG